MKYCSLVAIEVVECNFRLIVMKRCNSLDNVNLHVECETQSCVEVTDKYLCQVAQKRALSDHAVVVLIKYFKEPLANNSRQITIRDEGHPIYLLFFDSIRCQASK